MAQKKFVLIVDDESEVRALIKESLAQQYPDLQVLEAGDGAEAMRKISRQFFDVVIFDLKMPKIDGNTAIKSLKELPIDFRPKNILVLSGHATAQDIKREFGNTVEFLAKPCSTQELLDYFKKAIAGSASVTATPKAKFDTTIVNCFIEATMEVLKTMANVQAQKQGIAIRSDDKMSGDISALIAVQSEKQTGSMALSFDELCFLSIAEAMLGEKFTSISDQNADLAAELCNQIFGVTKKMLNEKGYGVKPAIPSVILGKGHQIKHTVSGPCIAVRFQCPTGSFTIETALQENAAADTKAA